MAPKKRMKRQITINTGISLQAQFAEVAELIRRGRKRALASVNTATIDTYWRVGEYISKKVERAEWGTGVVSRLSDYLAQALPDIKGFSDKNLWRMKKFYEVWRDSSKLSTLLRQLPWSSHLHIISKAKSRQEREFYLKLAIQERLDVRSIARAIDNDLHDQTALHKPKLSTALREQHPSAESIFRDSYSLDFLGLPDNHSETDLRKGIVRSLKNFIIEFGRDFAFVGEEYRVQVGLKDFFLDLLFYHRELRCLVAFELKIDEFKPEYLGKLSFYLEALDRDVKKPHENPSIGIILCKGEDDEVVEYALSRTLSPAAIADYTTKLPDKKLLQDKLHEFFDSSVREMRAEYGK
jgi:predicted nuclease of restriction endonuclease-like (RecB) superfamily